MKRIFLSVLSSLFLLSVFSLAASADPIDVSTISCEKLASAYAAKTKDDISFVNGILNWMGGYHATADQGTVVDWDKLSDSFNKTVEFCSEHPGIGVLSATEKFMGENIEDASPESVDLAIVTCETVLTNKDVQKNIGDTFMWLAGYHASYNNGSTILDIEKFIKQTSDIADYCAANPKMSLVTAAEKFMSESE
ncbi:HdeA/HdeB family chaperone [Hyphomicrobium sp.]|uniref:HdeA/HdeB family chaperone n=1 Tax=Hyphomicrobium sp. TaxID=82 RepID=UPI001D3CA8B8|nr:HdeA/HdeB family chaperone [Hyphomicrobium sp.]MBY0561950.1 HdeA family protein [Hyphomicrobium sp.]